MANTIKLFITSKLIKTEKNSFRSYKTKMLIDVINEDGTKTKQPRIINVSFCGEKTREFLKAHNVRRGFITCKATDVNAPFVYEITIDEKTNKKVYPVVKIFSIEAYEDKPFERSQGDFITGEEDKEINEDDLGI